MAPPSLFSASVYEQLLSYIYVPFLYKHLSSPHIHVGSLNLSVSSKQN